MPTFACDAMLGSLARWLRFAGFDTRFLPGWSDAAAVGVARAEGRWFLTRDRTLASSAGPRVLLLVGSDLDVMIAELRARFELSIDPARFFTRCAACNGELRDAAPAAVVARVPPYVAAHVRRFRACPECARIYWEGSHVGNISKRLEELFLAPSSRPE